MTTLQQKLREISVAEFYVKALGLVGELRSQERPDFLLTGDRKIGIEITEYHQPAHPGHKFSRSKVEAEWEKIRALVRTMREDNRELDNLSVSLEFKDLDVPGRNDHAPFVNAVLAEIRRNAGQITEKYLYVMTENSEFPLLRKYLKSLRLRRCGCYMEWDWNHNFASVGTSDEELLGILRPKLALKKPLEVDELHLVMAGDGPSGGAYIGMLEPDWLEDWTRLTAAIAASEFDAVTILNYEDSCIWRRDQGWSKFGYAK